MGKDEIGIPMLGEGRTYRPFYKAKYKRWRKTAILAILGLFAALVVVVCVAETNRALRQELAIRVICPSCEVCKHGGRK